MTRDFKGIWIPKRIWLIEGLKPAYRIFLAEIDSLDNGEGCVAKNEHFSALFGLSKNRCSEIIKMLSEEGYISISYVQKGENEVRFLNVLDPFGKSNPPSENRQTPSENRQHLSKYRQHNIYELETNRDIQKRERRAYEFLKNEAEIRLEDFEMKFKRQITDFEKFVQDFDDTVDLEQLNYFPNILLPRLSKYARNWIANQSKYAPVAQPVKNGPLKSMD
jgi:hypothetical protein